MIISRTPLRISLAGGGTDIPSFFESYGGAVLSAALDKYVFVTVRRRFDDQIRAGYTRTEIVSKPQELQHELMREALYATGIERSIEITTISDVPAEGTGLGSSSAVTVGLLQAMYQYTGVERSTEQLAREACEIEIDRLRKPIGKQDQYISAFGGLRVFRFHQDGSVTTAPVRLSDERRIELDSSLLLFYTGISRSASEILGEAGIDETRQVSYLSQTRALVDDTLAVLTTGDLQDLGMILHESWRLKRSLSPSVSSVHLNEIYEAARRAGATGGKITGAGGGGFFLFFVPIRAQAALRAALTPRLRELPFHLEPRGAEIVLDLARESGRSQWAE